MKYLYLLLIMAASFSFGCQKDDNVNPDDYSDDFGTFTDERDGQQYNWVKIGDQIWMAENLAYLPAVSPEGDNMSWGKHYFVYGYNGNDVDNAKSFPNYSLYGVLYNLPAAITACPEGWHLSSDDEWKQLELFIGMNPEEINIKGLNERGWDLSVILKDKTSWGPDANGTDDYGFSAIPGGLLRDNGKFSKLDYEGYWWSPANNNEKEISAIFRSLGGYFGYGILRHQADSESALSVRCIKD